MKRTIVLGLTGSVATVLYDKLIKGLQTLGDVVVILTEKAEHFVPDELNGVKIFRERHEWQWMHSGEHFMNADGERVPSSKWKKNDPVLHIKLRDRGSALVIAPCSANTMGKLASGICDNLLTSVARAWDMRRPVIIAPAMNTHMWDHPVTQDNIVELSDWGYEIIEPQEKMLACGTKGMGALADIDEIVETTAAALQWVLPIESHRFSGIPVGDHPGAFSTQRKHEKHTGVDLYCKEGTSVYAVESGMVVGREHFTGEWDKSPWWNNTDCLLVEGATGVVCYGEIEVARNLDKGCPVDRGDVIGYVKRVLKDGKERKDIPGHSTSMLHMELYPHGTFKASDGFEKCLQDPTPFLLEAAKDYKIKQLTYGKKCS